MKIVGSKVRCNHRWDDDGERCVKCGEKDWMQDEPPPSPKPTRTNEDREKPSKP